MSRRPGPFPFSLPARPLSRRGLLLFLLLLIPISLPQTAAAPLQPTASATVNSDCRQRFAAAIALFRNDRKDEAAKALADTGRACDDAELAAESLFRAAQLYDEELRSPEAALALYADATARAPQSSYGQRARQRLADLQRSELKGPGAAAMESELNQLTSRYQSLGFAVVIARLERLLKEGPPPPLADRARYLLGTAYRDSGQESRAEATWARLVREEPSSRFAPYAEQALGILALRQGKFQLAEERFRLLKSVYAGPIFSDLAAEGLTVATRERQRQVAARIAWGYLGAVLLLLLVRGHRRLWPPPVEVRYYLPVALFLLLVSRIARGGQLGLAMHGLTLAGTLLIWLGGAAARSNFAEASSTRSDGVQRRLRLQLVVGLLARLLAAIALAYLVLYHSHLINRVLTTLQLIPESG